MEVARKSNPPSPFPNNSEFRVPPQDLEAEQSVLGAMMLSSEATRIVIPLCKSEDFYREAHRKLYQAIVALDDRKEPVDIITLTNELKRMGEFDTIGGEQGGILFGDGTGGLFQDPDEIVPRQILEFDANREPALQLGHQIGGLRLVKGARRDK